MMAGDRLMDHLLVVVLRILRVQVVAVVTVDPQPLHFASTPYVVFADDRNVVFRLARYDAGIAADATFHSRGG